MNPNHIMYGFFDEMEKTGAVMVPGMAAGLMAKARSAWAAVEPLASKAWTFAKNNPYLATEATSAAVRGVGAGAGALRERRMQRIEGPKPKPIHPEAMRPVYG